MNKAYKFRIYPDNEQRILIAKTFGCVRFVYNKMLGERIEHYKQNGKSLKNTPAMYKKEFEWLKEVDSLALANAQLHLDQAYRNFFRDKAVGFPKFKAKRDTKKTYTTNLVNGNIRLEDNRLVLPKLKGIKIKKHRDIPSDYKLKSVTLSQSPTGKYYASILYEYEIKIEQVIASKYLGLDFSMDSLYVSSDGESANYPRYYRKYLDKLKREQRKLSKCEIGSNNRNKQRLKVAKLHEKVTNLRNDFQHKLSRQIANANDCICVEDLNLKGMSKALHLGKGVSDNAYGMFLTKLEYKLQEQGKSIVKVGKWYPSTKICSKCGTKREIALSERVYECSECGLVIDRDYNASINICEEGKRLKSA